ncbi:MAG: ABC transporter ATP-binding protein [Actinomycetes bacterium]
MISGTASSDGAPAQGAPDGHAAVELENVTKRYGDVTAIEDFDLRVEDGEFLTLLGPSGCGKTTTLRLIGGFEAPNRGEIRIGGEDMSSQPAYRRPVNTVFQQYALFPHLSVSRNIGYGLKHAGTGREETARRVEEMMHLMQIPDVGDRRPRELSGGQQQRVALARALVMNPKVLLLDEPLGSLDYKLRKDMQFELKRIHREVGVTFIYVTHDQEEAMTMSDRIVVMSNGHIEQDASPAEIFDRPRTAFVADFIGDTNIVHGTVTRIENGHASVDLGPLGEIGGSTDDKIAAGDRVRVSIRPTDVRVEHGDSGGAVVQDSVLVGGHIAMKITSGSETVVAHVGRGSSFEPGSDVRLHVDSDRIRIFADKPEPAADESQDAAQA